MIKVTRTPKREKRKDTFLLHVGKKKYHISYVELFELYSSCREHIIGSMQGALSYNIPGVGEVLSMKGLQALTKGVIIRGKGKLGARL